MALDVTIAYSGTTYNLKAEVVTVLLDRQPFQIPLPGATVFMLDLGMMRHAVSITGSVDASGSGTNPGVDDLDTAGTNWWAYGTDCTLTVPDLGSYTGRIKSFSFRKEAGHEFWQFSLEFLVET
jgi:hypothetical protein